MHSSPRLSSPLLRGLGAVALLFACGYALPTASAQLAPAPATKFAPNADFGPGLSYFDIRLDADGVPLAAVTGHIDALRKAPGADLRARELQNLTGLINGVTVDDDPILGTPRFVRSTARFLTLPAKINSPRDLVRSFVADHQALFEIDPAEVDKARVERDYGTDHNGMRHLTYQQQIRGIDLFESEIRANVTATGELINISSTMLPRPAGDFATPAVKIVDYAAIIAAAANVGINVSTLPVPKSDPAGASLKRTWADHPDFMASEPIVTELVYFLLDRDTIHPAWSVVVPQKGVGHIYEMLVDATDGTILRRHDRLVWDSTQPVSFRVFQSDGISPGSPGTPTPSGFQFPIATSVLLTYNPADVIAYSPNGWITDGNMETLGNNLDAHTDIDNNNLPDLPRPNGGASRVFDITYDTNQSPSANQNQKNASVIELFWRGNWYHDRLMTLGFNEAAGNFQTINFTALGTGNDAVQADAQDGSGTNNANFGTSGGDGTSARCQMYIFTGPSSNGGSVNRDGAFDGDIVYHEFTHGTSTRLHHGLSGTQPGGMGEGWSDYYAVSLLAESTDDPDAVYATGGYTTWMLTAGFTNNYYFGIRRFPYSTDLNKSPLTFADIDTAQFGYNPSVPRSTGAGTSGAANEVHNVGEVWCQVLLECRAQLWHTYGFAGNQKMLQYVTDAMKLSVANPNFLQARDAILQAALAAPYNGADTNLLWTAFAKRGMGSSATSPASSTTTGIVEAFNTPNFATFAYPDSLPTVLQPGVPVTFHVNITGTNLTLTPGSGTMYLSVNGGAFSPVPMIQGSPNQYTITIPAQSCFGRANFYFLTGSNLGNKTDPPTAPTASFLASVASVVGPAFLTDSFETDTGWVAGAAGDNATTGIWVRSDPVGVTASGVLIQPEDAHSGAGTMCWVTGNAATSATANGTNDVDGGHTTLTSPNFNLSAYQDVQFSYWRWYSSGSGGNPYTNTFRVDVSTNGGSTWTNAETLGPGSASDPNVNPGWRQATWKLSSTGLSPTATVKLRFVAEDITGAVVEAALDDFSIAPLTCAPPSGSCCAADGSCAITATAVLCTGVWTGGGTCTPNTCPLPTGSCCAADGGCTVTTQAACSAVWTGAGICTPNPCPQPNGACCAADGSCTVTIQSACSATWTIAGTCTPNTCPQPPGACCQGVACSLVQQADCTGANTRFAGVGTTCNAPGNNTTPCCRSDFNQDGISNVNDIFGYLGLWFAQQGTAGPHTADFDGDTFVGVSDIFAFLAAWFTGCH